MIPRNSGEHIGIIGWEKKIPSAGRRNKNC